MSELALTGLDGTNPLAFLAAIGTLEALTDRGFRATLRWENRGFWTPILASCPGTIDEVVSVLNEDRKDLVDHPALQLEHEGKQVVKVPIPAYRSFLCDLTANATPAGRIGVDLGAALASDVVADGKGNLTKPTALHFTAGQQQFLRMVRQLCREVTKEDLVEALSGPWQYQRKLPVLAWDATIARDYALRASNPSGDKKTGVPGADWLGFRGLVAFPSAVTHDRLGTAACHGRGETGSFVWPLWYRALGRDVVRSVITRDWRDDVDVRNSRLAKAGRTAAGVAVLFESMMPRSEQRRYGSMTPPKILS